MLPLSYSLTILTERMSTDYLVANLLNYQELVVMFSDAGEDLNNVWFSERKTVY